MEFYSLTEKARLAEEQAALQNKKDAVPVVLKLPQAFLVSFFRKTKEYRLYPLCYTLAAADTAGSVDAMKKSLTPNGRLISYNGYNYAIFYNEKSFVEFSDFKKLPIDGHKEFEKLSGIYAPKKLSQKFIVAYFPKEKSIRLYPYNMRLVAESLAISHDTMKRNLRRKEKIKTHEGIVVKVFWNFNNHIKWADIENLMSDCQ